MSFRSSIINAKDHTERLLDQTRYKFVGNSVKTAVGGTKATFRTPTFVDFHRARRLSYERTQIKYLLSQTKSSDIFWDIGGCVGTYTCFIGQKCSKSIVFEPHPGNRERIKENIRLNSLADSSLVRSEAITAESGDVELTVSDVDYAGGHHSLVDDISNKTITVRGCSGDDLINEGVDHPDIVKVDVEGAELDVIEGMKSILSANQCRLVFIECHPKKGSSVKSIKEKLQEHGFDAKQRWSNEPYVVAHHYA